MTAPQFHPATFALQGMIGLSNEIERELARLLGVHPTDYRALSALSASGPVTVGGLAAQLGATAATTTAIVTRLERHGYVERRRTEQDRRLVHVSVTADGFRRVMDLMGPLMHATSDYLQTLPPDAQRAVTEFFEIVHAQMHKHLTTMSAMEP